MNEIITIEEAQAKLEAQRREKVPAKMQEPESVETLAKTVFSRLKASLAPATDEEKKQERRRNEATILNLKERWNVPGRHADRAELVNDKWKQELTKITAQLGKGFVIGVVGTNGGGKTQLGVEVMRFNVEQRMKSALYATAIEIFMDFKACYRPDSKTTEKDAVRDYCRPGLLVIDEAGKRADTQWENNLLFEIIDRRYREMKDTLLISNQTPAEFTAGIGAGLTSRLNETGGLIIANWGSFRDKP